jgi:integrase
MPTQRFAPWLPRWVYQSEEDSAGTTPHCLRHTFAVRSLLTCPDGRDHITKHILMLSTYLGHSNAALTYWYQEAVPELMRSITAQRYETVSITKNFRYRVRSIPPEVTDGTAYQFALAMRDVP